jgi:hypothetical protein
LDHATVITEQNWQQAVFDAVDELPADILASVGHATINSRQLLITVAVEPSDEGEAAVNDIRIRLWDTLREQEEHFANEDRKGEEDNREEFGLPRQSEHYTKEDPNQTVSGYDLDDVRLSWPVLSIDHAPEPIQGLFLGRATFGTLKGTIQLAICEEMFGNSAMSMILKDREGRFIREDGSPILSWQYRSKPH